MSYHYINAADLVGHWINGQTDAGSGARRGDVFNPAKGRVARQVALASRADVDRAVAAAKAVAADNDADKAAGGVYSVPEGGVASPGLCVCASARP